MKNLLQVFKLKSQNKWNKGTLTLRARNLVSPYLGRDPPLKSHSLPLSCSHQQTNFDKQQPLFRVFHELLRAPQISEQKGCESPPLGGWGAARNHSDACLAHSPPSLWPSYDA